MPFTFSRRRMVSITAEAWGGMPFTVGIPRPVSKGTEMRQPVRVTVPT
jgi:hypothetical protein